MKVSPKGQTDIQKSKPAKLTNEEIQAKIMGKFGDKAKIRKPKPQPEDTVEVKSGGVKSSAEKGFGDLGTNDPNSDVTQEKLKDILKSGAFSFNDRERQVLGEILK